MKNLRYATEDGTVIQAEDDAGNILNIPADPMNRHYAELQAKLAKGAATIAAHAPDQAAAAGARQQKVAARMMELLADDANDGKSLDEIRAEAKAMVAVKGERQG